MATIRRFEDINAWTKARELNKLVYRHTKTGPIARDFALRDQVRRASISVMSNIAEGFERNGNREFIQFLSVAKGSVGEVRSLLYVVLDAEYLGESDLAPFFSLADEVGRLLSGFMSYLERSDLKGSKRK